jgi:hypothetical protein
MNPATGLIRRDRKLTDYSFVSKKELPAWYSRPGFRCYTALENTSEPYCFPSGNVIASYRLCVQPPAPRVAACGSVSINPVSRAPLGTSVNAARPPAIYFGEKAIDRQRRERLIFIVAALARGIFQGSYAGPFCTEFNYELLHAPTTSHRILLNRTLKRPQR